MSNGFNPFLLKEARATAKLTGSTVDLVLPDIIRKWKMVNMPTLIGDFRRPPIEVACEDFQRARA